MLVKDVYNKAEWKATDDEAGKKRKRTLDVLQTSYGYMKPGICITSSFTCIKLEKLGRANGMDRAID